MPRDYDDYEDTRGVHRRRLQRKGSNTPIIVGAIVIGAALIGAVIIMMLVGGKDDPVEQERKVREGAETFLIAVLSGNDNAIFDTINVEGPNGWVVDRLKVKLSKRYRFWENEPDREEAMRWRAEQDARILREVKALPVALAIEDTPTVQRVVQAGKVDFDMASANIMISNQNGVAILSLASQSGGAWVVQNWTVKNRASGR